MCPYINFANLHRFRLVGREPMGMILKITDRESQTSLPTFDGQGSGYLEKPASLVFRGTLRDLSIGGRVINQRLTLQRIMSLPPNPHPIEVFRCAHQSNRCVGSQTKQFTLDNRSLPSLCANTFRERGAWKNPKGMGREWGKG